MLVWLQGKMDDTNSKQAPAESPFEHVGFKLVENSPEENQGSLRLIVCSPKTFVLCLLDCLALAARLEKRGPGSQYLEEPQRDCEGIGINLVGTV
jgi:hypothetical protein